MVESGSKSDKTGLEIAVIGMACRFPSAVNTEEFWQNLALGKESVSFFTKEELAEVEIAAELLDNPSYIKARATLENKDCFDASFFGYTPREAVIMDPQMRIFHECCWEALEHAGYNPENYRGIVGIYAGGGHHLAWETVCRLGIETASLGEWAADKLTNIDHLCTRIAYNFDLRGPGLSVQTACSTSLTALHLACQALLSGECHIAIAGGVSLSGISKSGYLYQEGMVNSPDGHCRAFDAEAMGTVGGEGAGVVVLKPLEESLADRDFIHAVIKGSAANNDGHVKVGFTAPGVQGQVAVIQAALRAAAISPESLGYVETHGTGTIQGDPIEFQALCRAFNSDQKGFCALGSVKTNIGHIDTASGVAGFIKAVLVLKHRRIPPSLHFQCPHPQIDIINSPFYISAVLHPWEKENRPLRAGVSSFGIGGTNVHVVLEEAPEMPTAPPVPVGGSPWKIIALSAATPSALECLAQNLAGYLRREPGAELADVAYTLLRGRKAFQYRGTLLCRDHEDAIEALTPGRPGKFKTGVVPTTDKAKRTVFIFPGGGAVYLETALELYRGNAEFARQVGQWAELFKTATGKDLIGIFQVKPQPEIAFKLTDPGVRAVLVFILQYSLAKCLTRWGIKPSALLGYGPGQYTAACLSGIFSPTDALKLVLLSGSPGGGTDRSKHVPWHDVLRGLTLNKPEVPYICTIKGRPIRDIEALDPAHWLKVSMVETPFSSYLALAGRQPGDLPVVIGAGEMPENVSGDHRQHVIYLLPSPGDQIPASFHFMEQIARSWRLGLAPDWEEFYRGEKRRRLPLPTYPFERHHFPMPGNPFKVLEGKKQSPPAAIEKCNDISRWFYVPSWKSGVLPPGPWPGYSILPPVLVVTALGDPGEKVVKKLEKINIPVITLEKSEKGFEKKNDNHYLFDPCNRESYERIAGDLAARGSIPRTVLHFLGVTVPHPVVDFSREMAAEAIEMGFYSPVYLIKAIANLLGPQENLYLLLVTNHLHDVMEEERLNPGKAVTLGPCRVVPLEFPNISCKNLDIVFPPTNPKKEEDLLEQILNEAQVLPSPDEQVVALRGRNRWVQTFTQVPLRETAPGSRVLKKGGVYLVTGGVGEHGGIGFFLGRWLWRRIKARLVFAGRTPLPPRHQWTQWLTDNPPEHPVSVKIRRVMELEAEGAEVLCIPADVSDRLQLLQLKKQVEETFGKITGILHTAAVMGEKSFVSLLEDIEKFQYEEQFLPKIYGLLNLYEVFEKGGNKDSGLDFCILCSSLASLLGGIGVNTYSAANNFMDAFVQWANREHPRTWFCLDWDNWQRTGNRLPYETEISMTPDEGVEAFGRVLSWGTAERVIISTAPLQAWFDKHRRSKGEDNNFEFPVKRTGDMGDWFYLPCWKPGVPAENQVQPGQLLENWLVFKERSSTEDRLVEVLTETLKQEYRCVVVVEPGPGFSRLGDRHYRLNPQQGDDYRALFKELAHQGQLPGNILHLWTSIPGQAYPLTAAETTALQDYGLYSLVHIAQAAGESSIANPIRLLVVSRYLQEVTGGEKLCPAHATLLGAVKIIPLEYGNIFCRSIDIGDGENSGSEEKEIIPALIREFSYPFSGSPEVAYRGKNRLVRDYQPVRLEPDKGIPVALKEKGVYLVTGGLGGMGFTLAAHLARTLKARLVLTDISEFPPRDQWDHWLSTHGEEDENRCKIEKIRELERTGAAFLVETADVSDYHRMEQAVGRALDQWGPIDGVIHTAGIIDYAGIIRNRTRPMTEDILSAKVGGTLVLEDLFKESTLDFLVLFSSIGNILYRNKFGQLGYNAGHEFLDAYAAYKQRLGTRTAAIDWNDWTEVGIAVKAMQEKTRGRTGMDRYGEALAISPIEGIQVFERIMGKAAAGLPRLAVSTYPLGTLMEYMEGSIYQELSRVCSAATVQRRPDLTAPYSPPGNRTERVIAAIFEEFFGIQPIGIDDDFFELGGDSLKAMTVVTNIHKELGIKFPLAEIFKNPTIRGMSRYMSGGEEEKFTGIEAVEEKDYYEPSSAQKRLYFLQRMDDEGEGCGISYNESQTMLLEGRIDRKRLEVAFKKLIQRHESLRTSFHIKQEEPAQRVHDSVEFKMDYFSLKGSGEGIHPLAALIKDFIRPFDLNVPPLLRVGLAAINEENYLLMVDMHHIVCDGTSHEILKSEFLELYAGRELPLLPIRYKDFSAWQNKLFRSAGIDACKRYWLNEFAGILPVLNLPTDFSRPAVQSFDGDYFIFEISEQEKRRLNELAKQENVTLFMLLLTVFFLWLSRLSGQEDIIVGVPVEGRNHADLKNLIGMFVNTLALRHFPAGEKRFRDFLMEIREKSLDGFENQVYQFEELVNDLNLERDPSRNPLFDVKFVLQNIDERSIKGFTSEIREKESPYKNKTSKFDLSLDIKESGSQLRFIFEYSTTLFRKETINRYAKYFKEILFFVIQDPQTRLADVRIISEKEKEQVLYGFNDTEAAYPHTRTIHWFLSEQVLRNPNAIALVCTGEYLTYRELEQQAAQMAHFLHSEGGVQAQEPVAVLMNRSIDFFISVLGILKAGAAYVPISPAFPEERIKSILLDAEAGVVISGKRWIKMLNRLQWECPSFHTYLCIDSLDIASEIETDRNELMDEKLWKYIGESAVDDITGGGWLTSYTGEPFSSREMDEYGDNILKKLDPLLNREMKVLEVGCASGISMYRIAPRVASYYGTDFSLVIIEKNRERIKREGYANIKVACKAAHEIDNFPQETFDLIIMNSVVHCFHGHNYFRQVIKKAADLLSPHGFLFLGDLMDADLKKDLVRDMVEYKREHQHPRTKTDWSNELFISRDFLRDLAVDMEEIHSVEFSRKICTLENELTRYRFDALLRINKEGHRDSKAGVQTKRKFQRDARSLGKKPGLMELPTVSSRQLAYIIYTSGSTGVPRGVMVEHHSVINRLHWMQKAYPLGPGDVILHKTPVIFDVSVWELFWWLMAGASVAILPHSQEMDPGEILQAIGKNKVSTIHFVPSMLAVFLDHLENITLLSLKGLASLKRVFASGEALKIRHWEQFQRIFKQKGAPSLINLYGPTEATVDVSYFDCQPVVAGNSIPIGKPIDNIKLYILDKAREPQPVGMPGELYISGAGLARGYLKQERLTAETFLSNPFSPGERMYKTGDLTRWLADGNIEFLGRTDHQVKIRGFRIELGEIEYRLQTHPGIKEVVVQQTEDHLLCAYYTAAVNPGDLELRQHLETCLPDYMIPGYWVHLEQMPLTPTGKIDRKRLPAPMIQVCGQYFPPRDDTEKTLVDIWSEVLNLGKEQISIDANFFHLGGHSLKATVLTSRVHKTLEVSIPIAEIFKKPTIEELSVYIKNKKEDQYVPIQPVEKRDYYPLAFMQKRLFFFQQLEPGSTLYNSPLTRPMNREFERERTNRAFKKLIRRHESFRTSIELIDHEPVQRIHDQVSFTLQYDDLRQDTHWEKKVSRIVRDFTRPFDLGIPPLLRAGLIHIEKGQVILMVDMHHIITDGVSEQIIIDDFMAYYEDKELHPLHLHYKDFACWQNTPAWQASVKKQESYWLRVLGGGIPVLNLPVDYQRPENRSFSGNTLFFTIGPARTRQLLQLAESNRVTLYMMLLAAFTLFLGKITGQADIIVGCDTAGRNHNDLRQVVGMFVNTLALRNYPHPEKNFMLFLEEVKTNTLEAFENQDYPLEDLVDKLAPQRDPSRNPFFDVVLSLQNQRRYEENIYRMNHPQDSRQPWDYINPIARFDLNLTALEFDGELLFSLEYCTRLFKPDTVETFIRYFKTIIEEVTRQPDRRISEISLFSGQERKELIKLIRSEKHELSDVGDAVLKAGIGEMAETGRAEECLEAEFDF